MSSVLNPPRPSDVGTDDQTAAEVSVAASPINYSAGTPDVEAHFEGVDTAIGSVSGLSFPLLAPPGTAADPTYGFDNGDAGIYASGNGATQEIRLSAGNAQALVASSNGNVKVGNGGDTDGQATLHVTSGTNSEILVAPTFGVSGHSALRFSSFAAGQFSQWTWYAFGGFEGNSLALRKGSTSGTLQWTFEDDGTLNAHTTSYETLIDEDNDIPNKKYVDDLIAALDVRVTALEP